MNLNNKNSYELNITPLYHNRTVAVTEAYAFVLYLRFNILKNS